MSLRRRGQSGISKRRQLIAIVGLALALVASWYAPASAFTADQLKAIVDADYLVIETRRKDGTQSTPAPVWFTTTADNQALLIETASDSWKGKRIRRGSPVIVWIKNDRGPAFIGHAEITKDPALQDKIIKDFPGRYFGAAVGFNKPSHERFDSGKWIAVKISPIQDLPAGFAPDPGKPFPQQSGG